MQQSDFQAELSQAKQNMGLDLDREEVSYSHEEPKRKMKRGNLPHINTKKDPSQSALDQFMTTQPTEAHTAMITTMKPEIGQSGFSPSFRDKKSLMSQQI